MRGRRAIGAFAGLAAAATALAAPSAGPRLAGCRVLPADNPWNARVDRLPVAPNSTALIRAIGLGAHVHADFGAGLYNGAPIGIPVTVAGAGTPHRPVSFAYASESDRGPYPLPRGVAIEGGPRASGDRHVIVLDRSTCTDYELYAAYPQAGGRRWRAGSGAIFHLGSDRLRAAGWTSADAAGLPILPGLARPDEVMAGEIAHALRFTAPRTRRAYVYPARHEAGTSADPSLPPMGLRVRLKASARLAGVPRQARVIAREMQRYGLMLADNGSPWYVSGVPDARWNNDDLHALGRFSGADFEVVDTRSLPSPQ